MRLHPDTCKLEFVLSRAHASHELSHVLEAEVETQVATPSVQRATFPLYQVQVDFQRLGSPKLFLYKDPGGQKRYIVGPRVLI